MYKLMIIDDDEYIRERLKSIIAFDELELTLSCEASNGQEALELFDQFKPDIVITDISIPLIDGLTVAREMQRQNENLGLIVITGYGTLEFAQEAIKAGTAGFILKPINRKELNDTLESIILRLEKAAHDRIHLWQMESLLNESLPLLRERYLSSILTDSCRESEEEKREHFKKLNLPISAGNFCITILIPNYLEIENKDCEAVQIAIANISGELLSQKGLECISFFTHTLQAVLLVQSKDPDFSFLLEQALSVMRDRLRFYFTFDFYGCIGKEVTALNDLSESYQSAIEAIQYKDFFGENNIVNSRNVFRLERPKSISFKADIDWMEKTFMTGNAVGMEEEIQRFFSKVTQMSGGSDALIRRACIELMVGIRSCAELSGIPLSKEDDDFFTDLFYSNSIVRTKQLLLKRIMRLNLLLQEKRSSRISRTIQEARRFIEEHLTEADLNLTKVSEAAGLSPVYFCSLFKKETGIAFVDYLNQIRVEKAKALLASTPMKIYEVSEAVGYSNPKYFFQIFKKITGQKPREYSKST